MSAVSVPERAQSLMGMQLTYGGSWRARRAFMPLGGVGRVGFKVYGDDDRVLRLMRRVS